MKLRRYLTHGIGVFLLQLLFYAVLCTIRGTMLMLCILCIFLCICAVFTAETDMLHHKIGSLKEYTRYMLPFFVQIIALAALDAAVLYVLRSHAETAVPWLIFSLIMLLLGGIAVFAVGAARTVLHHQ